MGKAQRLDERPTQGRQALDRRLTPGGSRIGTTLRVGLAVRRWVRLYVRMRVRLGVQGPVRLPRGLRPGPDRGRERQIIAPPRHDVHVQVRHLVAEAGDIDFVGRQFIAKNALHPAQDLQQFKSLRLRQIRQFHDMLSPDQAQQPRPLRLVSQDQPPGLRLMQ